ncbi:hypothetical protein AWM68_09995 [Fictibacillus phosphorivorans]|uniref:LysM domain-containing protein n=1 Tax=Fictibacillus phosphorivorans TaxID=1221500 RepID=A0A163Q2E5_9BACL|nr:LysM peptidoglycan-binding domain-containing protein [Fictibacillus phosphorivorans]KZE64472.1 hypothetical protein AWM68_09995 [Fictibacillus phosphorivorans]
MSQSKLRFSIEESVWLKKGQEVAEVLSMSLDPEIRITEEAGQVYIKGALILNGRYRAENQEQNAADFELTPLAESVSYRSLTQLSVAEDGVTDLVHRFPVDITIPSYRVEDSNEVKVEVESFEYELPNSTCFELSASICIYGIKDEKQRQESPAYDSPKEEVRSVVAEERSVQKEVQKEEKQDIFTPFQFEARQSGGVPSQPQPNEFLARFNENNAEVREEKKAVFEFKPHFESSNDRTMEATFDSLKAIAFSSENTRQMDSYTEEPEARLEEEEEVYGEVEAADQNDYTESYNHEEEETYESYQAQQTPDYEAQEYHEQANSYQSQPSYQDTNRPYPYNPYQQQEAYHQQPHHYANYQYQQNHSERPSYSNEYEYGEQSYEAEQEYEESNYELSAEDHDTSYEYEDNSYPEREHESQPEAEQADHDEPRDENALYLTKMLSAKEERFSKMKMYILQRGDSLEHICERYDISLNTLMRMNRLQQGEVSEGQIIYIPVSSR